jgi:hypothetical protein
MKGYSNRILQLSIMPSSRGCCGSARGTEFDPSRTRYSGLHFFVVPVSDRGKILTHPSDLCVGTRLIISSLHSFCHNISFIQPFIHYQQQQKQHTIMSSSSNRNNINNRNLRQDIGTGAQVVGVLSSIFAVGAAFVGDTEAAETFIGVVEATSAIAEISLSSSKPQPPPPSNFFKSSQPSPPPTTQAIPVVVNSSCTGTRTASIASPSSSCLICPKGHNSPVSVVPPNLNYQCDICNAHLRPGTQMYCCPKCPGSWSVCTKHAAEPHAGWSTAAAQQRHQPPPTLTTVSSSSSTSTSSSSASNTTPKSESSACLTCPSGHNSPLSVVPPKMTYECDNCHANLSSGTRMYCCSKCPGTWSVCTHHAAEWRAAPAQASSSSPCSLTCPGGHHSPLSVVPPNKRYGCDICYANL